MLEGVLTIDRSIDPDDGHDISAFGKGQMWRSPPTSGTRTRANLPTKMAKIAHSVALTTTGGYLRNMVGGFVKSVDLVKWVLTKHSANQP